MQYMYSKPMIQITNLLKSFRYCEIETTAIFKFTSIIPQYHDPENWNKLI